MNDVKLRIVTESDLRQAQQLKQQLEKIVSAMDEADGVAQDYKKTIEALNTAIANNQVVHAKQAQALSGQIRLAESLGVNVSNLKNQYQALYADLNKNKGGESMFTKMREDIGELAKEIPGLTRFMGKFAEIGAGPIGAIAASMGLLVDSTREFAETEVMWAKLDATLANSGHLFDGTRESYQKLMDKMADNTVGTTRVEWGNIILQLSQFGRTAKQVGTDVETIKNLVGVFHTVESATMAYTRAMNGQFQMFTRYGIMIPAHVSQLEKMNALQREAAQIGGGQLAAVQDTLIGQWELMATSFERLVTNIGTQLKPVLVPLKIVMHEIGMATRNLADDLYRMLPPIHDTTKGIQKVTESMGDAHQDMQEYQKAWTMVKQGYDDATKSLSAHDAQMEKSLNERKKFAKWQEDQDVAEIERTERDPVKRAALIAQRKAATVEDAGRARHMITQREIEEQQGQLSQAQAGIAQSDIQLNSILNNPKISPERKDMYRKTYAEQRSLLQSRMIAAQNSISQKTDTMNEDDAENQIDVQGARIDSLKEGIKTGADSEKSKLKNNTIPQLSPDYLESGYGTQFLQWSTNPRNKPFLDQLMDKSGTGQLDDFIKMLSAGGEENSGYQYALAAAKAAKARKAVSEAMIDIQVANANADENAAQEARLRLDEVKSGLQSDFRQSYEKWEQGGRKGAAPVYPLSYVYPNGRVFGAQPLTGSVSPQFQGLLNQYGQANFNRPTITQPVPQAQMVPESNANWWVDSNNIFNKPVGFDNSTMVMVGFKDGSYGAFLKGKDGKPDFTKVIFSSDLGNGNTPTSQGSMASMAPALFSSPMASAGVSIPQAGGNSTFGGGEAGSGQGESGIGTVGVQSGWWNRGMGSSGLTVGNAITLAAMAGGGGLLAKGIRATGRGAVNMTGRGLRYAGVNLGTRGSVTPSAMAEVHVVRTGVPFESSLTTSYRGESRTASRSGTLSGDAGAQAIKNEVENFTKNYDAEIERAKLRVAEAEKAEQELASLRHSMAPSGFETLGKSKEIEALEFLQKHPEWRSAINKGVRDAGMIGRNVESWTDDGIISHIMGISSGNVENGAYAMRRGSARVLSGLTAQNLRELGMINKSGGTGVNMELQLDNATRKAWGRMPATGVSQAPSPAQLEQLRVAEEKAGIAGSRREALKQLVSERSGAIDEVETEAIHKHLPGVNDPLNVKPTLPGDAEYAEKFKSDLNNLPKSGNAARLSRLGSVARGIGKVGKVLGPLGAVVGNAFGGAELYKAYNSKTTSESWQHSRNAIGDFAPVASMISLPTMALEGAYQTSKLGYESHALGQDVRTENQSQANVGFSEKDIRSRIRSIIAKGSNATPTEKAWAMQANRHLANPSSVTFPAFDPSKATDDQKSSLGIKPPTTTKTTFGENSPDSAEGRADLISRQLTRMAGADFTKMSKDDMGELSGAFMAIHGRSAQGGELRTFADGLGGKGAQNKNYQSLYQYYKKAGYGSSSQAVGQETVSAPPAGTKSKVPDIAAKTETLLKDQLALAQHTVGALEKQDASVIALTKRVQKIEARP